MKGIISCEKSQAVTMEFRKKGHEFYSNDIEECTGGYPIFHYREDAMHLLSRRFISLDFLGFHPVCRFLANSGVRWLASKTKKNGFEWSEKYQIYINNERFKDMEIAALFFKSSLAFVKSVGKGYVENPIMHKYAMEIIGEKQTQVIQPWMFGDTAKKATCLWIVGLPNLTPTEIIPLEKRTNEIHMCAPGPERETIRSKTFPGIAKAMADQWGQSYLT